MSEMSEIVNIGKSQYINSRVIPTTHHDVFIDDDITDPSNYRDLISILFNSTENDTIHIFINSGGGQLDTALAIIEGLKNTQAEVTAFIMGACHSAASIIMMYCHNVIVLDSAYSMVHTASYGTVGNSSNVKNHTEFFSKQIDKLLRETYEGFLSKEEMASVMTGVELWFDSDEIKKRMETRYNLMEAKFKEQEKALTKKEPRKSKKGDI